MRSPAFASSNPALRRRCGAAGLPAAAVALAAVVAAR